MYKKGIYKILANEPLTASVWRMVLEGDTESVSYTHLTLPTSNPV